MLLVKLHIREQSTVILNFEQVDALLVSEGTVIDEEKLELASIRVKPIHLLHILLRDIFIKDVYRVYSSLGLIGVITGVYRRVLD